MTPMPARARHAALTSWLIVTLAYSGSALSAIDTWDGGGPLATGAGNRVIRSLAVGPDGHTLYAGTGSGTVFRRVQMSTTPVPFGFSARTGIPPGSVVVSDEITVTGITVNTPIVLESCSGTNCGYSINAGAWESTAGHVAPGAKVRVRQTAAASHSTETILKLAIGGVSGAFSVTTVAPMEAGACGPANGLTSLQAPQANLCTTGQATPVLTHAGAHRWSCEGVSGGMDSTCAAPGIGLDGVGTLTLAVDGAGCVVASGGRIPPPDGGPPGITMPFDALQFSLEGCATGGSTEVTVTYSAPVDGMRYWKHLGSEWITIPATLSGNSAIFTLVDGGPLDADGEANGRIVDPGGPGVAATLAIPALSAWALALLAGILVWSSLSFHTRHR